MNFKDFITQSEMLNEDVDFLLESVSSTGDQVRNVCSKWIKSKFPDLSPLDSEEPRWFNSQMDRDRRKDQLATPSWVGKNVETILKSKAKDLAKFGIKANDGVVEKRTTAEKFANLLKTNKAILMNAFQISETYDKSWNANVIEFNFPLLTSLLWVPVVDDDTGEIVGAVCYNLSTDNTVDDTVKSIVNRVSVSSKKATTVSFEVVKRTYDSISDRAIKTKKGEGFVFVSLISFDISEKFKKETLMKIRIRNQRIKFENKFETNHKEVYMKTNEALFKKLDDYRNAVRKKIKPYYENLVKKLAEEKYKPYTTAEYSSYGFTRTEKAYHEKLHNAVYKVEKLAEDIRDNIGKSDYISEYSKFVDFVEDGEFGKEFKKVTGLTSHKELVNFMQVVFNESSRKDLQSNSKTGERTKFVEKVQNYAKVFDKCSPTMLANTMLDGIKKYVDEQFEIFDNIQKYTKLG